MSEFLDSKLSRIDHYKHNNVKSLEREIDLTASILNQLVTSADNLADVQTELQLVTAKQTKIIAIHRAICEKMKQSIQRSIFAPLADWFRNALAENNVRDIDTVMQKIELILAGTLDSVESVAYESGDTYACPLLQQPTSVTSSRYAVAVLRASLEKLLERIKTPSDLRLCLKPILECVDRIAMTLEMTHKFEVQDKLVMNGDEGHRIINDVCAVVVEHLEYLKDGYLDRPYYMTVQRIQFAVDMFFWEHTGGVKPDWNYDGVEYGEQWQGERLYQLSVGRDENFHYFGTEWADEPASYAVMMQLWLKRCGLPGATELLEEFCWLGRESEKEEITEKALTKAYEFWREHEGSKR